MKILGGVDFRGKKKIEIIYIYYPKNQPLPKKVREIEEFMFSLHQQLISQIDPAQRTNVINALELLRSSMEAVKAQIV